MRKINFPIVVLIVLCLLIPLAPGMAVEGVYPSETLTVGSSSAADFADLQTAIDSAPDGAFISVEPGIFQAVPQSFTDPQCGNCLDPATQVEASYGFVIRGKSLTIIGSGAGNTELKTGAGYGIYIEDCPDVGIFKLAVSGGIRDADGNATDAAVVVRRSLVEIGHCGIKNNVGDFSKTVAGVGGVMGREGAILHIHHNKIHDNTWDGVALYRGASANIHDNEIWNGRGAGVGITWDSHATVIRNDIHNYWKGIGSFGNTRVGVFNNFVHDLDGWGIVATESSEMVCRNNTVVHCGNVGIAGWNEDAKIEIVNNIIAFNGSIEQWVAPRVGIWMNCEPDKFIIANNCIFGNYDCPVAFGIKESEDGTWSYDRQEEYIGRNGNIDSDPMLVGDGWALSDSSPCINAGYAEILDPDGTVSDIGATGGQDAMNNSEKISKP
ncbi:MAG: right-handed parallel beta-helix repeat-containing protein [bacterium]